MLLNSKNSWSQVGHNKKGGWLWQFAGWAAWPHQPRPEATEKGRREGITDSF